MSAEEILEVSVEQLKGKHQVDTDNQNGWFLSCKVGD